MESYEYTLPVEQWWQILANVSHLDLCNVVLTSRHMNSIASLPELWAGMEVSKKKLWLSGLTQFYNINRFKKIKQINFSMWGCGDVERLLKEIPGSPLENADLTLIDLSGVSVEVLSSAVSHLHTVNLDAVSLPGIGLTTDQCVGLLEAISSSTTLKNLNLMRCNLSKVPAELLATTISQLQNVNLVKTDLTTDQCVALLKASISSTTLTNVDLMGVDISQVPDELLANSLSRLEDLNLYATCLATEQCIAILKATLCSKTLKNIDLDNINLSRVPAELLANSISGLQDVNLRFTDLTTDQCVAILKASLFSTTLRRVDLWGANLSKVPAELLATSISRLQHVHLCRTQLTTDQCVALLKASLSSTRLRNVYLDEVDLSKVDAELLASSISRLEYVSLVWTHLTAHQCVPLLKAISSSTTLHYVDLWSNGIRQKLPDDQQYLIDALPENVRDNCRA